MKYTFLDFETYYSKEYSLRVMTPIEYILDPRFELTGCAIAENTAPAFWVDGPDFKDYLQKQDPRECVFISHNALFDMCINSYRYNFVPKLMIDTMGMARATLLHRIPNGSVSLETVAQVLELGMKGKTILQVEGMNTAAIKAAGLWQQYVEYALNDVELCRGVYYKLRPLFPTSEILVNDSVIRCAITPKFELDQNVLAMHAHNIQTQKALALARSGVSDPAELRSDEKFAHALRTLGIDPPIKISKRTGKQAYAFAKTDHAMIELEEHENPVVQALVAARLGFKTTIEESRTARFQKIAALNVGGSAKMPMPLRYGGAHTHRLGGDWKLNVQNLPRPTPTKPSPLRDALRAPVQHRVLAVDASQIEARIAGWLCGQNDLVEQFRRGDDTYSLFASDVYSRPINKRDHPLERFVGKQAILGLGFGMGAVRFEAQIKSDSHKQGITLTGMDIGEATRIVNIFRNKYPKFKQTWNYLLYTVLPEMTKPECNIKWGPVTFLYEKILLPNGLHIHYHKLRYETNEKGSSWCYNYGRETKYLHGGKVLENIVQALARIHTMDHALLQVRKRVAPLGLELALQVHDELVFVVPDDLTKVVGKIMVEEMGRVPKWAVGLPLASELHEGATYGECK